MERISILALIIGIILIGISIYFFLLSISLLMPEIYAIVSGLTSLIIGFITLGSGVSLIRSYIIVKAAEKIEEREKV